MVTQRVVASVDSRHSSCCHQSTSFINHFAGFIVTEHPGYTHTHTHTHTYIYIYIYIYTIVCIYIYIYIYMCVCVCVSMCVCVSCFVAIIMDFVILAFSICNRVFWWGSCGLVSFLVTRQPSYVIWCQSCPCRKRPVTLFDP